MLQDACAEVMEPDKCEAWMWAPYKQVPEPVFQPVEAADGEQLHSQSHQTTSCLIASSLIAF